MSKEKNRSLTNDFVKGGQVTKNSVVMFWQNVKMIFLPAFIIYSSLGIFGIFQNTTEYERYLFYKYHSADVHYQSMGEKGYLNFRYPDGEVLRVKPFDVIKAPSVINAKNKVQYAISIALILDLFLTFLSFFGVSYWLKRKGQKLGEVEVIDGVRPVDDIKELQKIVKEKNEAIGCKPRYKLCGVDFLNNAELVHMGVAGNTGQGKTQVITPLIEQVVANNDRAFIYDKARYFTKNFYNESKDIILNPLDARSPPWNIHAEAKNATDYEEIFAVMIPMAPNTEPYWTLAARTIASKTALRFRQSGEYRMRPMLEKLYNTTLAEIAEMLKGTEAAALIDAKNPKTGESLRSVMSTYIKCLGYCYDEVVVDKETGKQDLSKLFSITSWVTDNDRKGMIFVPLRGNQAETLKPLISTFFNICIVAGMSIEVEPDRRIFVVIDELPSLQQLPALLSGAAELRQFGFSFVAGWQLYSQLVAVYQKTGAETIAGLLTTRVQFNAGNEENNVRHAANQFGKYTLRKPQDSLSIGVGPYRDGANFGFKDVPYNCVTEGDIRSLPPLTCYLQMAGGGLPVAKYTHTYHVPDQVAEPFVERPLEKLAMGSYLVIGDDPTDSKVDDTQDVVSDEERPQKPTPVEKKRQLPLKDDGVKHGQDGELVSFVRDGIFDVTAAEKAYKKEQQEKAAQNQVSSEVELDDDFDMFK